MKTYIFYTPEGYTGSPNGENIENMQILGFAAGQNVSQALESLLNENDWIKENGFHKSSILAKQLLDNELRLNIQKTVDYLWIDEKRHFEEDKCDNHIFSTLIELKKSIK